MQQVPVAYLVFDVLYAGGELLLERPLRERGKFWMRFWRRQEKLARARVASRTVALRIRQTTSPIAYTRRFARLSSGVDAAGTRSTLRGRPGPRQRRPDDQRSESPYTPGRRGKSWLKLKRELATLDVVVTAVEYGHGKRIGVLSDYTFAVRDGEGWSISARPTPD